MEANNLPGRSAAAISSSLSAGMMQYLFFRFMLFHHHIFFKILSCETTLLILFTNVTRNWRSQRKSAQKKLSDRCVCLRVRGHLLKNKWLMGELEGFLSGLCVSNILHVEIQLLNTLFIAYRNFVDRMKQKTHSSLVTKSPHFYHNGIDYMVSIHISP